MGLADGTYKALKKTVNSLLDLEEGEPSFVWVKPPKPKKSGGCCTFNFKFF